MPTVQIRTRLDRDLKRRSDPLLASLGLDAGTFFSMALTQLVNKRAIPFAVAESDEAYFTQEYGLTSREAQAAGARMRRAEAAARRDGTLREIRSVADLSK
jgi:addiction module RelB/DinJ family antitoxin